MVRERIRPGFDFGDVDVVPKLAIPVAKIQLSQASIDDMSPTPVREP
jgi:hypothetical protein